MASESSDEIKPKGILKKGDDAGKKKKSGTLVLSVDADQEHRPKKDMRIVETSTGIVKKDSDGNIIEDKREKPRGERQQIKPKSSSSDKLPSNDIIASGNDVISPDNIIIQPSNDISNNIIQPSNHIIQPSPSPKVDPEPHPSSPSKDHDSKHDKEKCIIS